MGKSELKNRIWVEKIIDILKAAKTEVIRAVNYTMVYTYYEIGHIIIEEEQSGDERAGYGKQILKDLSKRLTSEFGKGFSVTNLQQMKNFYTTYRKQQTLSATLDSKKQEITRSSKTETDNFRHDFKLSWSHYLKLMRISNTDERSFYELEAANNNWSLREMTRQINSELYLRLALSTDKKGVIKLSQQGHQIEKPIDVVKDPFVLEFLGLPESPRFSETDLENELINKLKYFLLELGKGYTFVARQKRISFDERHFFIDLVFYNRLLRCFVLIDLKIGDLKHQDLGQIQMYVNYFERYIKLDDENPSIGIVLCKDKSQTLVEISLPESNQQIFASRYQTVLPSKRELEQLLETKMNSSYE